MMTNQEYHSYDALGSTMIKTMARSMLHFWDDNLNPNKEPKEDGEHMFFGELLHVLVLEPHLLDSTTDRLSKFKNGQKALDKIDNALRIAESIHNLAHGQLILNGAGIPEHTIIWEEQVKLEDGSIHIIKCKCRLDYWVMNEMFLNGLILDLKTTRDASQSSFERDAENLKYFIQAAWYCRGAMVKYKLELRPPFIFLAGEKESPYCSVPYLASDDMVDQGWKACQVKMIQYAKSKQTGVWPGYPTKTQILNRPRWAKRYT